MLCWWQDDTSGAEAVQERSAPTAEQTQKAAIQETNNGTTQAKTGTPSLQHCHPLTAPTRGLLRGPRGNRTTEVAALDCDISRQEKERWSEWLLCLRSARGIREESLCGCCQARRDLHEAGIGEERRKSTGPEHHPLVKDDALETGKSSPFGPRLSGSERVWQHHPRRTHVHHTASLPTSTKAEALHHIHPHVGR